MIVAWYVWSSGLEEWERIRPNNEDVMLDFKEQHVKRVAGRKLTVYRDSLGRFVASLHAQPWEMLDELPKPSLDDQVALLDSMTSKIALEIDSEVSK